MHLGDYCACVNNLLHAQHSSCVCAVGGGSGSKARTPTKSSHPGLDSQSHVLETSIIILPTLLYGEGGTCPPALKGMSPPPQAKAT